MIVQLIVVHDEVIDTHSCTSLDQSGIMFRVLNTKKGSAVWVGVHARMHCFTHCNNDVLFVGLHPLPPSLRV